MRIFPRLFVFIAVLGCTPLVQAILRLKFRHWFPYYEQQWLEASQKCKPELANYYKNIRTATCPYPCACAANCILKQCTGTMQSNFASAQVLLGLVPTVIVFGGPTVADVAALSTYRPLLAVFLSLGSPAINVHRLFEPVDIRVPFKRSMSTTSTAWSGWLARRGVIVRTILRILPYVAAIGAIAINVQNSIYTDLRTICGWRCGALFMPLAWSLLGVAVHGWGMVAVRARLKDGYSFPSIKSALKSKVFQRVLEGKDNILSDALFWLSSLFAIIHMVFGILTLSSLVFITALEALGVFAIYACSVVLCQLALLFELANMRNALSKEPLTALNSDNNT